MPEENYKVLKEYTVKSGLALGLINGEPVEHVERVLMHGLWILQRYEPVENFTALFRAAAVDGSTDQLTRLLENAFGHYWYHLDQHSQHHHQNLAILASAVREVGSEEQQAILSRAAREKGFDFAVRTSAETGEGNLLLEAFRQGGEARIAVPSLPGLNDPLRALKYWAGTLYPDRMGADPSRLEKMVPAIHSALQEIVGKDPWNEQRIKQLAEFEGALTQHGVNFRSEETVTLATRFGGHTPVPS